MPQLTNHSPPDQHLAVHHHHDRVGGHVAPHIGQADPLLCQDTLPLLLVKGRMININHFTVIITQIRPGSARGHSRWCGGCGAAPGRPAACPGRQWCRLSWPRGTLDHSVVTVSKWFNTPPPQSTFSVSSSSLTV